MTQNNSLLPPNATPLLKDIEAVIIGRLLLLDVAPLQWLSNPDKCNPDILPWLAWAMAVDVWQNDWPLETQKSVVRRSVRVHKLKGTIGALRQALDAFEFVDVRVEEWFEYAGEPYMFRVFVTFKDDNVSLDDANLIYTTIMTTKNLRSHLESFRAEIATTQEPKIAAAFGHLETTTIYPRD